MHENPSPHFLPWPCSHMLLLSITAHNEDMRQWHSWGAHQSLDGKLGFKGPPTASLYFHPGFLPSSSPLLWVRPTPAFQLCPHFLCVSSYKGTNPTMGGGTLITQFSPKALHPNTITLEIRASTYECWKVANIQSISITHKNYVIIISCQN